MTSMIHPLVSICRTSKTFGEQRALNRVDLEFQHNEIHALVGENGSGKSTLIKILAGFYTPDDGGEIKVEGNQLRAGDPTSSHALGLRFVHQNLGLVDDMSGSDNIGLVAGFKTRTFGVSRKRQRKFAGDLLAQLKVDIDLDKPVSLLRPVERTTVAIARAIAPGESPIRLLVLDEPTAALPPAEVDVLFDLVRGLRAAGVSVLYVSHRLDEILALSDQVSVLRDGQFQGTFDSFGQTRESIVTHILGEESQRSATPNRIPTPPASQRMGDAPPALTVTNLRTKRLRDISFSVGRGEILGFVGLEGSGREDLAGALGGAISATGLLTDGEGASWTRPTARAAREHGVALALANWHPGSAITEFDVRENISLPRLGSFSRGGAIVKKKERNDASQWLTKVDVRPRDTTKPFGLLSGGNKQKVIIAKWLATEPRVIVLDDPTSGVDIGARHQLYELIREQAALGVGVVLCSSDLEDIIELCDRAISFNDGSVSAELRGAAINEASLLNAVASRIDQSEHSSNSEEEEDHNP